MQTAAACDAADRVFLDRALELALRGAGNTAPNPPVGAVVVAADGTIAGEGRHHRRGEAHAEVEALAAAGPATHGATLYVSLEPCDHSGATPPCTRAIMAAGITRVVAGTYDPNPRTRGAGIARLREAGIPTVVADTPAARAAIEPFSVAIRRTAPYLALKLAVSLDGYVAPVPGPHWLTGEKSREAVREMRAAFDAVMVGAGTVSVDDPQLTVRPPRTRLLPNRRVVVCDHPRLARERRIFDAVPGYAPTIVLAAGPREGYRQLEGVAEIVEIAAVDGRLDLASALAALAERGVSSVLCEGGPKLASRLLAGGFVDRMTWLIAPQLLARRGAVPALVPQPGGFPRTGWSFDRAELLGDDVLLSAHRTAAAN